MRISLLTPEIFSSEGGLSRILRLYLKALCELAEPSGEVRLVTLIDPTIESKHLRTYANDRLVDWYACSRSRRKFVRAVFEVARETDLMVCGHVNQLRVAALAQLRYPKLRYVLVAHGIEVWRSFSLTERLALNRASAIWCVSDFTRREILRRTELQDERVVVLPNALDPAMQSSSTDAPTEMVILTTSRLTWADRYKGIDHLISAFPEIKRRLPNVKLRIIGRGDDLPRLQGLAGEHLLNGDIQFLGFLSDQEMARELSNCRIFALPSEKEGFGLVFLEAMTHGKPCIAADAGGAPEVISASSGLLCRFGDVADLANQCVAALQRDWDANAIRARAETFSYANFRDRLRTLLNG